MKDASFIFLIKFSSPWAVRAGVPAAPRLLLRTVQNWQQESLPQAAPIFEPASKFAFRSQITNTQPRPAVHGRCCSQLRLCLQAALPLDP